LNSTEIIKGMKSFPPNKNFIKVGPKKNSNYTLSRDLTAIFLLVILQLPNVLPCSIFNALSH
ncbi:hypothetical protein ABXM62_13480, partial [Enterococcus faecium]|uniref:hypothetical protein n=1 Tax=Enterococcus faecium TaxID=1352 RepID=UPI00338EF15E